MLLLKVAFEISKKKGNIFKGFQTNKITTFLIGGISFRQIRKRLILALTHAYHRPFL